MSSAIALFTMSLFVFAVILLIMCLSLIISAARNSSSVIEAKPRRLLSFATSATPTDVTKVVVSFVQRKGYEIDYISESNNLVVISASPTLTTWGFFYPIYSEQRSDGATLVEVGIKSRFVQYGSITSRSHERFTNGIKANLIVSGFDVRP